MIDPADQVVEAVERVLRLRFPSAEVREWAVTVASLADDPAFLEWSRPPGGVDHVAALERYVAAQRELSRAWIELGRGSLQGHVSRAYEERRIAELVQEHGEVEGRRRYLVDPVESFRSPEGELDWTLAALSVMRELPRYRSKTNMLAMSVARLAVEIWCELGPGREPSDGNAAFLDFLADVLRALDVDAEPRSALKAWRRSHRKQAVRG